MKYFINEDIDDSKIVVNDREYEIDDEVDDLSDFDIVDDVKTSHEMLNHDMGSLLEDTENKNKLIAELKKLPGTAKYKLDKFDEKQLFRMLRREQDRVAKLEADRKRFNKIDKAWEDADAQPTCPDCGEPLTDNGECPTCKGDDLEYAKIKQEERDSKLTEYERIFQEDVGKSTDDYLKEVWNNRVNKVCEHYKKILKLESIPATRDLVEWAVDDCCIKYNQSKDNIKAMLDEGRGK